MFQDNSMKSLYDIRILFKRLNFDFLKKIRKKKIPITQESIIIIHQKIIFPPLHNIEHNFTIFKK